MMKGMFGNGTTHEGERLKSIWGKYKKLGKYYENIVETWEKFVKFEIDSYESELFDTPGSFKSFLEYLEFIDDNFEYVVH